MEKLRFGTTESLDMDNIGIVLRDSFNYEYASFLARASLGYDSTKLELKPTNDKPYTARADIPIHQLTTGGSLGTRCGTLYAILFGPNDGTGNESTYKLGDVNPVPRLRFEENPERVIPRSKEGTLFEVFFPILSIKSEIPYSGLVSLGQVEMGEDGLVHIERTLGVSGNEFSTRMNRSDTGVFSNTEWSGRRPHLTTGYDLGGRRFGDPHAVVRVDDHQDVMQVGGFLSVTEKGYLYDALLKALDAQL